MQEDAGRCRERQGYVRLFKETHGTTGMRRLKLELPGDSGGDATCYLKGDAWKCKKIWMDAGVCLKLNATM